MSLTKKFHFHFLRKFENKTSSFVSVKQTNLITMVNPCSQISLLVQVEKKQFEKVLSYIEHGKREGATLLVGGKPCGGKGYYIEPTIFTNVTVNIFNFYMSNIQLMLVRFSYS